jgi:hypothetical protein
LSAVIGYASAVLFKTVASSALIIFASELALLKVRLTPDAPAAFAEAQPKRAARPNATAAEPRERR